MTTYLLYLAAGMFLLYFGGEGMVHGSTALGLRLGMTPLLTGLTIVSFGTSAPELVVSLQATLSGTSSLAVGNVVGSNICNIGLILGLSVLFRPIEVEARLVRHDVPIMLACAFLLALLLLDGVLSRFEASMLLLALVVFIVFTIRDTRAPKRALQVEFGQALKNDHAPMPIAIMLAAAGAGLLVWGGGLFVEGAVGISETLGIAPAVIGLSVAAIGTSLPELATSVVAALRGHGDMAAGNVVGSNIFNTLSVLGISGVVLPLNAAGVTWVDLCTLILFSVVTLRLLWTHSAMERWEGATLVAAYLGYMAWLFR